MMLSLAVPEAVYDWSVRRKVIVLWVLFTVGIPLAGLLIIELRGDMAAKNYLVALSFFSVVLLAPASKWLSDFLALRSIKEINGHCQALKSGDYSHETLPPARVGEHDFLKLKRNMHWMGFAIITREAKLQKAMAELDEAQQQIGASLDYASLIQRSFLPDADALSAHLPKHFLLWQQRDAVGGDAYWFRPTARGFFIGVIDCTGHGVPGAFMTLIVTSLLDKAFRFDDSSPARLLGAMNVLIKDALGQNDREASSDDGMDCALCHVSKEGGELTFSGANMPLFLLNRGEVQCEKGDRCGLGYVRSPRDFEFTDRQLRLDLGTRVYLATDGVMDQVGAERGFPFGRKRFKQFIAEHAAMPISEQGAALVAQMAAFQGTESRRDDMTVIGFELQEKHNE